jgi:putative ABC transport system permease protein
LLRTLAHYWRVNVAVALGAAVATAVLSGALLVGDSVRGSLRELTLDRLGSIDRALVAGRFFREELADDLAAAGLAGATPAITLRGSASTPDRGSRASQVAILGVDERFAALYGPGTELDLDKHEGQLSPSVILNEALARELAVAPGEAIVLHFGQFSEVPRETLMGETDPHDVLGRIRLTVTQVIPDRGIGRFGIVPTQQIPLNALVELSQLQRALAVRGQVTPSLPRAATPARPCGNR